MYEEKHIKETRVGDCNVYKIQSRFKFLGVYVNFYIVRSIKQISKEDFLELANEKFMKYYGYEPIFKVLEYKPKGKDSVDPFLKMVRNRWSSLNQRCKDAKYSDNPSVKNNPQAQSYQKRNITLEMTREEFFTWMYQNRELHEIIEASGDFSSIDRIDESKNYSLDNIQLIPLVKNIKKRFNKGDK